MVIVGRAIGQFPSNEISGYYSMHFAGDQIVFKLRQPLLWYITAFHGATEVDMLNLTGMRVKEGDSCAEQLISDVEYKESNEQSDTSPSIHRREQLLSMSHPLQV